MSLRHFEQSINSKETHFRESKVMSVNFYWGDMRLQAQGIAVRIDMPQDFADAL
jgi:hypothetical protein